MNEPVQWLPDGSPFSPRFNDRYRSRAGAAAQAHGVFLAGCGLPQAWRGLAGYTVLETGFGLGANFLATWAAWEADPERCTTLHYVAVEAHPVTAADILRNTAPPSGAPAAPKRLAQPALQAHMAILAEQLATAWCGLTPGIHRLRFAHGRVHLTLAIGEVQPMLKALVCTADAVYLDGFDPEHNPQMWQPAVLQAVARHCRVGTCLASWTVAQAVRESLRPLGFQITKAPGVPPKRHRLQAVFAPTWPLRRSVTPTPVPGDAMVIGAGLAGAHVAHELARRGWQVRVLDAANTPAAGASGLPVGLMATHTSPDDAPVSRASRAGLRATHAMLQHLGAAGLLTEGHDWCTSGALEQFRDAAKPAYPPQWSDAAASDWLHAKPTGLVHRRAAWIKPHALVRALLQHPNIRFEGGCRVAQLVPETVPDPVAKTGPTTSGPEDAHTARQFGSASVLDVGTNALSSAAPRWQVLDAAGHSLGQARLVVVCAATGSAPLLPGGDCLPVDAVSGQAVLAVQALPTAMPLNGDGHFIPQVPLGAGVPLGTGVPQGTGQPLGQGPIAERNAALAPAAAENINAAAPQHFWLGGATFERQPLPALDADFGLRANRERLARLLQPWPDTARAIDAAFTRHAVHVWQGQRCTIADRLPLVGEWAPGLHVCTALGSRGLSFAALCAELLVARLHGEPLALERRLVQALDARRPFASRPARAPRAPSPHEGDAQAPLQPSPESQAPA